MHLVSATTTMSDDPAFCGVLGLPVGEYALNGVPSACRHSSTEARPAPDVSAVTTWLD